MRKLILAAFVCLLPHALHAQANSPAPAQPVRDKLTPPAELREVSELGASVKQLYAAGKYKEALPLAERMLELCEKARGEQDPLVGDALANLAILYLALKKFDKAEAVFERILVRRERSKIATSPAMLRMLINYGCLVSTRGTSIRKQGATFTDRINSILLQDAVLAAGLPLPDDLSELSSRVTFKKPQPRYPREALSARLQGIVLVWVETDETGKAVNAEAVPCWSGQKVLADASVEAARSAQLQPVVVDGKPVKLKVIISYSFVMQ